jgi:ABC-type transport system substrate-binding protein
VHRVELSLLPVEQCLATALGLYEQDCLDVLDLNLLSVEQSVRARQRFPDCITTPRLTTCFLAFHPQRPPFDDPLVRRAFILATDREWLSNVLWQGTWSPPTGGFVPSGMPGHTPGIALPYDPDRARDLLAEAGYVGDQGFPALDALAFRGWESDLEALSERWHTNLGVKVDWEILDFAGFLQRLACDLPHMYLLLWRADYPDPDSFLRSGTERLTGHWRNQTYNALVEQARRITAQAERMNLYEQADRMLVQEAVITPLAYWREHTLVKPWITRYPTSAVRAFMWQDVVIEPH